MLRVIVLSLTPCFGQYLEISAKAQSMCSAAVGL